MLSQFSFCNYKSFREEALLDFSADAIQEHLDSLLQEESDGESHLPVVCIYGPNGSGKSTVLDALRYLRNLILFPVQNFSADDLGADSSVRNPSRQDVYHKFCSSSRDTPITFDVLFYTVDMQVKYELALLQGEIVVE